MQSIKTKRPLAVDSTPQSPGAPPKSHTRARTHSTSIHRPPKSTTRSASELNGLGKDGEPPSATAVTPTRKFPQLNFVVLGAEGVGKSAFISCALDLKKPLASWSAAKKMSLEGEIFLISLIEVQLDELDVSSGNEINWSTTSNGDKLPQIDGILALYDVTDRESIMSIPEFLSEYIPALFYAIVTRQELSIGYLGTSM
jgi:hypothetical protein